MRDLRFPNNGVFCANCGRDTGLTHSELYNKMNFNCPYCGFKIKATPELVKPEPTENEGAEKSCPFRFIGYRVNPERSNMNCQKEKCGVWSTEHNCCGFAAISRGVY